MKFATLMREAGISTKIFKECWEIDVILYDDDDQISQEDDIHFTEELFEGNLKSFVRFVDFICELSEKSNCSSINVQITEDYVIVFYKTPNAKIFPRK